MTDPIFLLIIDLMKTQQMDKEKLKLIVRNLESLVECLKSEIHSDTDSYLSYDKSVPYITDYDEVFEDSDLDDYEWYYEGWSKTH